MTAEKARKRLVLPMKGKWYDMILSGEKREEYRLFKPYWIRRISNWLEANRLPARPLWELTVEGHGTELTYFYNIDDGRNRIPMPILFVNGYSKDSRRFVGWCDKFTIWGRAGHPEWGEGEYDGKPHFVLHISNVERIRT